MAKGYLDGYPLFLKKSSPRSSHNTTAVVLQHHRGRLTTTPRSPYNKISQLKCPHINLPNLLREQHILSYQK